MTTPSKPKAPKPKAKQKRALAGEIARAIELRGYRPGEWLRQIDIEQAFKATRFDVRSALEELAVRKTIEHVPNRGYRVAEIDMATYRAVRDTRIVLETATAPGIIAGIDEAGIDRLADYARQFGEAVHSSTRIRQSEINHSFHRLMYSFCGNPVLAETIWSLRDRSRASTVTVWTSHQALLSSDRDHHAMVAAIKARDAKALSELIHRHIDRDTAQDGASTQSTETAQARGIEVSDEA
jgi:DNA-binding GntR family transcriptional regulator